MHTLVQDLRHAWRSLIHTPTLTLAAVLSLGLGIGANTTVFTWVQSVLLRPIPGAQDPSTLYATTLETREGSDRSWSYPNYRDLRDRASLVDLFAQRDVPMSVSVDGRAERAYGALVTGNYFQVIGVQPLVGRLLSPQDDHTPGAHPVIVLSHAYWQRRFGGTPDIVGRQVTINNTPMTVIGVAAAPFVGTSLGLSAAAWVPMAMQPQLMGSTRLDNRGNGWMQTFARLKPGVAREQAQAELAAIIAQLGQAHPDVVGGFQIDVVRAWEANFGASSQLAPILAVLAVVVALVLLIACANAASLLLSRAVGRRREVAIRLSLGANRSRLVRQLLSEAMLVSLVAGSVGVLLAYWTSDVLMAFAPPTDMPISFGLGVDATTVGYAAVVSLVTGVLFGLAPAWQVSRPDTAHALKEEAGRGSSGGRTSHRLRSTLVVAQIAVCLVLLIGAGLFMRSLQAAYDLQPGFDPDGLLVASVDLFPNGYTPATGRQFHHRLTEAIAALPGVQSVALGRQVPLGLAGNSSMGVTVEGYVPRENEEVNIGYNAVGPRYFETMKIPMARGREFATQDTEQSPRVVIVNETMAARYWPGREAIGGRLRLGTEMYQVIGVAKNINYARLAEGPQTHIYLALEQNYISNVVLHVRTDAEPVSALATVRDTVRRLDTNLPLFDARSANEHMVAAFFAQKMGANLLGAMAVLAVILSAVGLYGVIAYAVSQRTHEMGIRLALGAAPADLLMMVLRQGLLLTGVGLAIGLVLAFVATGFMRSLLPGIAPRDPITFIGVPLLLTAIATVAALIPARRASSVDPLVALRYE
ncbi:MAG TPA: ABC transporter permease [Vicinamibacterales bacterium]|nr:ABC transporter permease [Vicinamibacterales bacterium]